MFTAEIVGSGESGHFTISYHDTGLLYWETDEHAELGRKNGVVNPTITLNLLYAPPKKKFPLKRVFFVLSVVLGVLLGTLGLPQRYPLPQKKEEEKNVSFYIGAFTRIGREIRCLLYARYFKRKTNMRKQNKKFQEEAAFCQNNFHPEALQHRTSI